MALATRPSVRPLQLLPRVVEGGPVSLGLTVLASMRRDSIPAGSVSRKTDPPGAEDIARVPLDIDVLYREHGAAMYRVAVSVVRDHALAEDVVQDSVIKAWRNRDSYRGEGSVKSWLLRITHNTAVSTLRRLRDTPHDPTTMPERTRAHVESEVEDGAFLSAFEEALFELDELSRTAVALRELEGMPYEMIAQVLGVPLPTVKTRLYRARHVLMSRLSNWTPS